MRVSVPRIKLLVRAKIYGQPYVLVLPAKGRDANSFVEGIHMKCKGNHRWDLDGQTGESIEGDPADSGSRTVIPCADCLAIKVCFHKRNFEPVTVIVEEDGSSP